MTRQDKKAKEEDSLPIWKHVMVRSNRSSSTSRSSLSLASLLLLACSNRVQNLFPLLLLLLLLPLRSSSAASSRLPLPSATHLTAWELPSWLSLGRERQVVPIL